MSAGKDPMLRGNPAPSGYASSVSGWIQQHVAQERLANPSANMHVLARLNTIDGCSSAAVAAGDEDPRIRTLALASPGPRWTPGPQQVAAVQGAGHKPGSISGVSGEVDDLLTGDRLLDTLAHGAMLDMQAAHQTELATVRKAPETPPTATAVLNEEREGREKAERLVRELRVSLDTVSADYIHERDQRRNLQRILSSTGAIDVVGDPAARDQVPVGVRGVRERGEGRFEALLYRTESINGKQRGVGTFPTVEEAVAARAEALKADAEAKAAKARTTTMPEVSAAGGYDQMTAEQAEAIEAAALTA
jgi:hypothetical protein